MARIVILHPGAMGAAVGRALRDAGHEVGWMLAGRSAAEVAGVVRGAGATYVDGSVIGPPPVAAGTSRMQLSGAAASLAAELFTGSRIEPVIVTEHEYGASAVKMAYAAWTKISAALLLAADAAAASYGAEAVLQAEWARSQPDLARRRERAHAAAREKGWRWTDEMRQIAETFTAAGQPSGFGDAAAAVYARHPKP